jgi:hypothetical protein
MSQFLPGEKVASVLVVVGQENVVDARGLGLVGSSNDVEPGCYMTGNKKGRQRLKQPLG